jgi:hypothetical protein
LIIRSGNAEVRATPYGRIVAGAVGRVDLSSAAFPNYGYMLLRVRPDATEWQISHRQPNPLPFSGGGPFDFGPIVHAEPLTKTAFEQALDSLF